MENTRIQNPADIELVQRLKNQENSAWDYVMQQVVLPVIRAGHTRHGIPYQTILQDKAIDEGDVLNDLYVMMIHGRKLDNYAFRASLKTWMRCYVIKIILGYCSKYPSGMSEIDENTVIEDEGSTRKDVLEATEKAFKELWRRNPMKAYVTLLKIQNRFSSTEIRDYLGLSSEDNVDKIYSRAKADMKELIQMYRRNEQ